MKPVTIIVPVYNGAETVVSCLKAILALDYPPELMEVIVVDDGSTDNTAELVSAYAHGKDSVRLVRNGQNKGRAFSRLVGAMESRYQNLLLVDSRVLIASESLKAISTYPENDQLPAVIRGNGNLWDRALMALRRAAFPEFYRDRPEYLDADNFDRTPKGTTALYIEKEAFVKATHCIAYERKDISDDTRLLSHVITLRRRIYFNPGFAITYLQRNGIRNNLRHLYHRGPKFVDYYYARHKEYTRIIQLVAIFGLVFLVLIALGLVPILFACAMLCAIHLALIYRFGRTSSERRALFLVLPLIVISFGLGILQGLLRWRR